MPALTHSPQTRPNAESAYYQARPARWPFAGLRSQARQLLAALTRRARRLSLPRPDGYKLEPMPRMRWYT